MHSIDQITLALLKDYECFIRPRTKREKNYLYMFDSILRKALTTDLLTKKEKKFITQRMWQIFNSKHIQKEPELPDEIFPSTWTKVYEKNGWGWDAKYTDLFPKKRQVDYPKFQPALKNELQLS